MQPATGFSITDEHDAHDLSHRQRGGGFLYDGTGYTPQSFIRYVQEYDFGSIPPNFVVLHHTATPDLFAWTSNEAGLSTQALYDKRKRQLDAIQRYYEQQLGWDRGPHLFIDEHYIWVFTPMFHVGIHAGTGNGSVPNYSIGIEVVGNYDMGVWPQEIASNVGVAVAVIKDTLGTFEYVHRVGPGGISAHRDYRSTNCPGKAITTAFYLQKLTEGWEHYQHLMTPSAPPPLPPQIAIHPTFIASWERSGGVWKPEHLTPGHPTAPAVQRDGLLTQAFERGVARLRDGQVEWLLLSELAPVTSALPHEPVTPDSPLLSTRAIAEEPVVRFILSRDCGYDAETVGIIVRAYLRTCAQGDLDPAIAIAQMLHETGNLTSFWSQPPRHNLAGIGVTGQTATAPMPGYVFDPQRNLYACGVVFPSLNDAVIAHCGRLLAYALSHAVTDEQDQMIHDALVWRTLPERYRGCAPTLAGLAGTWATDQAYAEKVARKANEVLAVS